MTATRRCLPEWTRRAPLQLRLLAPEFAVCRLDQHAAIPGWATAGPFYAITRTGRELSIVCPAEQVPQEVHCQRGWRCLEVDGPLDFSLIGVLASLTAPLAQAGVSVFALSTYDTDYLLVQISNLDRAITALAAAGHMVHPE